MSRGKDLTKEEKRERAEARKRVSDKLTLEQKLEKAIRNGHDGTREVKRLKAAITGRESEGK